MLIKYKSRCYFYSDNIKNNILISTSAQQGQTFMYLNISTCNLNMILSLIYIFMYSGWFGKDISTEMLTKKPSSEIKSPF